MPTESYYDRLRASESGGNDASQASTSSALGRYQITRGTWAGLAPRLGYNASDRGKPEAQEKAIRLLTADNEAHLSKRGVAPTDLNLHMAHFLGPVDAVNFVKAYSADPNTPAANVVRAESVAANRSVFFHKDGTPKTVGEIYQVYGKRFGDQSTAGYAPPGHYTPAANAPGAPTAATIAGATAPMAGPAAAAVGAATPAAKNPWAATVEPTSGTAPKAPGSGSSGYKMPEFKASVDPYEWKDIQGAAPPPLPMATGGRARQAEAPSAPMLPTFLSKDPHFSKVWASLHADPSSVSHGDLLKAYHTVSRHGAETAPAQPSATQEQAPVQPEKQVPRETQEFASGGAVKETTAGSARKTADGYIKSDTGGTADKLSFNVVHDSYVIPADVVSGLGHGNSDAGAKIIAQRYNGRLSARTKGDVPVKLSGGEYVIPPHVVKRAGGGDIERGVKHFENVIQRVRNSTIDELRNREKPVR